MEWRFFLSFFLSSFWLQLPLPLSSLSLTHTKREMSIYYFWIFCFVLFCFVLFLISALMHYNVVLQDGEGFCVRKAKILFCFWG